MSHTVVLKLEQHVTLSRVLFLEVLTAVSINTFAAIDDLSRFNNSRLKLPASTLVDLNFQSRALRSFSLNQLRDLSL